MEVLDLLDKLLIPYKAELKKHIGVEEKFLSRISSTIYTELANLKIDEIEKIKHSSPIEFEQHFNMLVSFDEIYKIATASDNSLDPTVQRNIVQYSFYMLFVFLKDNCFEVTKRAFSNTNTITKKLCNFLLSNDIRAFRNALAHGNWVTEYINDGKDPTKNVIYFSKKNGRPFMKLPSGELIIYEDKSNIIENTNPKLIETNLAGRLMLYSPTDVANFTVEPLESYKVSLDDIHFWQTVTRVTAYTIYTFIKNYEINKSDL